MSNIHKGLLCNGAAYFTAELKEGFKEVDRFLEI